MRIRVNEHRVILFCFILWGLFIFSLFFDPFICFAYSPGRCMVPGLTARPPYRAPDRKLRYFIPPAGSAGFQPGLARLASTWGDQPEPEVPAAAGRPAPVTKSQTHAERVIAPAAAA